MQTKAGNRKHLMMGELFSPGGMILGFTVIILYLTAGCQNTGTTPEPPKPTDAPTLLPTASSTSEVFFDGAQVTFIDNDGFLITVEDKKILIDALFDTHNPNSSPPQEVLQKAVNGEPPFDQIDVVIATHSHSDHFSADLVREYLRNNQKAVFVSTWDAVRRINQTGEEFAERLISVNLEPGESSHLSINGIELDCLYISHGYASDKNIGVVITVGDYTFFHSGDMVIDDTMEESVTLVDLQGYGLHQKEIDLAFLPSYLFFIDEALPLIQDGIQARYVSPMHYHYRHPPMRIDEIVSNAVVFKDILENWVVPLD